MMVSIPMTFLLANSTEYLVSVVDGTLSFKELNSVDVRLLSTRFHVLVIISSFALTLGLSEVLSVQESRNLRDSNSLRGVGFGLSAKGVVSLYAKHSMVLPELYIGDQAMHNLGTNDDMLISSNWHYV
ncbi:hypothetical protein Tco_0625867 [Tanacetum coccineum]|uniref:Uncharacterized protein n=1 Tax=Tanacetum coccineum TaxID=301880 RepID=A0ABQ4WI04_9ASTR